MFRNVIPREGTETHPRPCEGNAPRRFRNVIPREGTETHLLCHNRFRCYRLEMLFPERGRKPVFLRQSLLSCSFRNVIPGEGTETSLQFHNRELPQSLEMLFPERGRKLCLLCICIAINCRSLEMLFPERGRKPVFLRQPLLSCSFRNVIPREGTETFFVFVPVASRKRLEMLFPERGRKPIFIRAS